MALCLGTYGDPRGVAVSYERGPPLHVDLLHAYVPQKVLTISHFAQPWKAQVRNNYYRGNTRVPYLQEIAPP